MGQPPPCRASADQADNRESFAGGGVGRGGVFVKKTPLKGNIHTT